MAFATQRGCAAPGYSLPRRAPGGSWRQADETASLVLTCSPRRLSEQGRLSIGGWTEPVSVPDVIRLCDPLLPKRCRRHHQLRFLQEGLSTPVRFVTLGYAQKSPPERISIDVGATGSLLWVLDSA
jgi:hypothetical protein